MTFDSTLGESYVNTSNSPDTQIVLRMPQSVKHISLQGEFFDLDSIWACIIQ